MTLMRYAKFIVAVLAAAAIAVYTLTAGGEVQDAVTIALAVLGAFGVLLTPNRDPKAPARAGSRRRDQ